MLNSQIISFFSSIQKKQDRFFLWIQSFLFIHVQEAYIKHWDEKKKNSFAWLYFVAARLPWESRYFTPSITVIPAGKLYNQWNEEPVIAIIPMSAQPASGLTDIRHMTGHPFEVTMVHEQNGAISAAALKRDALP
jgi:hypothetical protein